MIPFNRNSAIVSRFSEGGELNEGTMLPSVNIEEEMLKDPKAFQERAETDEWSMYDKQGLTEWEMWQMAENGETTERFADWLQSSIMPMPEIAQGMNRQEMKDHIQHHVLSIQKKDETYKKGLTDRYGTPMSVHKRALSGGDFKFELPTAEASTTAVNMNPYIIE